MLATKATVKAFYSWKFRDVGYLAFACGSGVFVVDELSRGYGTWESVDRFRKLQAEGSELASPLAGCAYRVTASRHDAA